MRHRLLSPKRTRAMLGLSLASGLGAAACEVRDNAAVAPGQVSLSLKLSGNAQVDTVHYVLTAGGVADIAGDIDSRSTSRPSALIGGLPAMRSYHLALSARSTDGQIACKAASDFALAAGATVPLDLALLCDPIDAGAPARIDLCASLGSRWSSGSTAPVGGEISFSVEILLGSSSESPSLEWTVKGSETGVSVGKISSSPLHARGTDAGLPLDAGTSLLAGASVTCQAEGTGTASLKVNDGHCPTATVAFPVECLKSAVDAGPNWNVNVCPSIRQYSVTGEFTNLPVGSSLGLDAEVVDANGDPLTTKWTVDLPEVGTITMVGASAATFVCKGPGDATVGVSVTDGHCSDSRKEAIYVKCVGR